MANNKHNLFDIEAIREAVRNVYRATFENGVIEALRLTQLLLAVGLDPADPLGEDKT